VEASRLFERLQAIIDKQEPSLSYAFADERRYLRLPAAHPDAGRRLPAEGCVAELGEAGPGLLLAPGTLEMIASCRVSGTYLTVWITAIGRHCCEASYPAGAIRSSASVKTGFAPDAAQRHADWERRHPPPGAQSSTEVIR
jgi:hypothetical protein